MSGYRERLIAYLTRLKDDSVEEIDDEDDNEVREASYVLLPYSQSSDDDDDSIGLYYECERY